ncbi:DUF6182 family protein [Streptomyces purpureus]|uniref:Uncharacterized protein n=1 Tax=Streptomyces purpureus TaxID=1951 RepID=A0A918HJ82_9ACTN|nr:DUF6182 family protein [Streptomyces purpureus]GGT64823.1 hypothetical protein GCM10014713_67350 [Streptomyces purpureus]
MTTPATLSVSGVQDRLRHQLATRLATARPDLARRHDLTTPAGLAAAQQDIAALSDETTTLAAVVVHHLDLPAFAVATCAYTASLDDTQQAAWRRDFTRTVFLAGNPANLRHRFTFAHTDPAAHLAYTAPGPAAATAPLRRLLKLFDAPARLPARPPTLLTIPTPPGLRPTRPPRHRRLHLATAGCTLAQALVHLNHLLAEAVMDGLITGGDRLTLIQEPTLTTAGPAFAAWRITPHPATPHHTGRLHAAAALTEETPHA